MSILFKDLNNTLADIRDDLVTNFTQARVFGKTVYQKLLLTPCGQQFPTILSHNFSQNRTLSQQEEWLQPNSMCSDKKKYPKIQKFT